MKKGDEIVVKVIGLFRPGKVGPAVAFQTVKIDEISGDNVYIKDFFNSSHPLTEGPTIKILNNQNKTSERRDKARVVWTEESAKPYDELYNAVLLENNDRIVGKECRVAVFFSGLS